MVAKREKLHALLSSKHLSLKLRAQLSLMNDDELGDAIEAIDKWLTARNEKKHASGVRPKAKRPT